VHSIPAVYFDGRQALPRPVLLAFAAGRVRVQGEGVDLDLPLGAVEIESPLGRTPRIVRFPGAAFCEVADHATFARLTAEAGVVDSPVDRWERSWRWVLAACVAFVLIVIVAYRYGIPVAAGVIAERLPEPAVATLSRQVLDLLDRSVFDPSELPLERQAALRAEFDRLALPGRARGQEYTLEFRLAKTLGANALALPSGRLVMTDALVALAKDDRELLAVAAHEAGHVDRRHGLRLALQSSITGLLVTWYVGDISSLAAGAPSALLEANYSRGFERDADTYAAETLARNGIPLSHFADILERMDASHKGAGQGALVDYLSSHPATADRIAWLRSR
jgi:Zn-dependent protease with chaperone function